MRINVSEKETDRKWGSRNNVVQHRQGANYWYYLHITSNFYASYASVVCVALGIKIDLALHITLSPSLASSFLSTHSIHQPQWPSPSFWMHHVPSCPRDSFKLFPLPWSYLPLLLCPYMLAKTSLPQVGPASWTYNLNSCTEPVLRRAPRVLLCSAVPVLRPLFF